LLRSVTAAQAWMPARDLHFSQRAAARAGPGSRAGRFLWHRSPFRPKLRLVELRVSCADVAFTLPGRWVFCLLQGERAHENDQSARSAAAALRVRFALVIGDLISYQTMGKAPRRSSVKSIECECVCQLLHRYARRRSTHFGRVVNFCVRCQISRPFDSERGPFADFAIEVGPTPGRPRSRSGDWPAATERWAFPCREARPGRLHWHERKVDYGREPDYAVLPTKIVCQSNRPAQVRDVRAGRLIWHGTFCRTSKVCLGSCLYLPPVWIRSGARCQESHPAAALARVPVRLHRVPLG